MSTPEQAPIPATLSEAEARARLEALGYPPDVATSMLARAQTLTMGNERSAPILRAYVAGKAQSQPAVVQPAQGASIADLSAVCQRCDRIVCLCSRAPKADAQGASLETDEQVSLECRGCGVIDSVDAGISAFLCSECTAEGKTHEALDAEERGGSLEVRARAAWDAYRQTPFTGLSFGNDEPNLPRWIAVVRAVDASRPAETERTTLGDRGAVPKEER